MLAEAKQILAKFGVQPMPPAVPDEDDAWMDALEAQLDAMPDARSVVTERSQLADFAVGLGS